MNTDKDGKAVTDSGTAPRLYRKCKIEPLGKGFKVFDRTGKHIGNAVTLWAALTLINTNYPIQYKHL